jgi:hypothetical protein
VKLEVPSVRGLLESNNLKKSSEAAEAMAVIEPTGSGWLCVP